MIRNGFYKKPEKPYAIVTITNKDVLQETGELKQVTIGMPCYDDERNKALASIGIDMEQFSNLWNGYKLDEHIFIDCISEFKTVIPGYRDDTFSNFFELECTLETLVEFTDEQREVVKKMVNNPNGNGCMPLLVAVNIMYNDIVYIDNCTNEQDFIVETVKEYGIEEFIDYIDIDRFKKDHLLHFGKNGAYYY